MIQSLLGKIAYVTGGSRGIGRASALAFAEAGADVAICHLDEEVEAKTLLAAAATLLLLVGPGGSYYCGPCLSPNGGDVMH